MNIYGEDKNLVGQWPNSRRFMNRPDQNKTLKPLPAYKLRGPDFVLFDVRFVIKNKKTRFGNIATMPIARDPLI